MWRHPCAAVARNDCATRKSSIATRVPLVLSESSSAHKPSTRSQQDIMLYSSAAALIRCTGDHHAALPIAAAGLRGFDSHLRGFDSLVKGGVQHGNCALSYPLIMTYNIYTNKQTTTQVSLALLHLATLPPLYSN